MRGGPASPKLGRFVRLAYLFSRYPIVSQTFCDTEMLALERMGIEIELYSVYPPPTSFRHGHAARLEAEIHYAPPASVLRALEVDARVRGDWPAEFIAAQGKKYGSAYKPELRARNALYFARLFRERGVTHFHVHFANRAAHTALFIKAISGIPYSMSTHGQDFMSDLGSDELLREICREAVFVANETEFSKSLVAGICPESAGKMVRVFNGMDLANFPAPTAATCNPEARIVSIGRLIEFKGFHHLIGACAKLRWRELEFRCDIIGEGPLRERLQTQIDELGLGDRVRLMGALPQEEVFAALRGCDIFALACVVDSKGASDVFPTVILEAMASAKPVVSTRLAGVPEQVIDDRTGLLVEPGDESALADALARLIESPDRRRIFGQEARARVETDFVVDKTVLPLRALFERNVQPPGPAPVRTESPLGVLVEHWPFAREIEAELSVIAAQDAKARFYVMSAGGGDPGALSSKLLPRCEFLPDGMVVEGEWQQERDLARRVELLRSDLGQRLSSELFLTCARRALFLRTWMERDAVRHLHAIGPTGLLTAWILRRISGPSLSATLGDDDFPGSAVLELAGECRGVRLSAKKAELATRLKKLANAPLLFPTRWKFARKLDPAGLAHLKEWSAAPSAPHADPMP